jgi:hypothetical protein
MMTSLPRLCILLVSLCQTYAMAVCQSSELFDPFGVKTTYASRSSIHPCSDASHNSANHHLPTRQKRGFAGFILISPEERSKKLSE